MQVKSDSKNNKLDSKTNLKTYQELSQFKLLLLKLLPTRNKEIKLYGMTLPIYAEASMLNTMQLPTEEDKN